jgi:hypothetical protein
MLDFKHFITYNLLIYAALSQNEITCNILSWVEEHHCPHAFIYLYACFRCYFAIFFKIKKKTFIVHISLYVYFVSCMFLQKKVYLST